MKKRIAVFVALIIMVGALLIGCTKSTEPEVQPEPMARTMYGRYYDTSACIITEDGHMWGCAFEKISGQTPYDNMPVWVAITDNGTPDEISDDRVLGCVLDRATSMVDELETTLSEHYNITREGNDIRIHN